MSLIRKHVAVLQAWACLDLVETGEPGPATTRNWRNTNTNKVEVRTGRSQGPNDDR